MQFIARMRQRAAALKQHCLGERARGVADFLLKSVGVEIVVTDGFRNTSEASW